MSVTVSKADGVTVFTLTSDPNSAWPPLCQILKSLCCSPVCCSVSQSLRTIQRASQTVLGTLQIMVGLLNIGLGTILLCASIPLWYIWFTGFPFWLGGLFMVFGIVSVLSERFPTPCLVVVNVILNLAGVAFAIAGVVLYSLDVGNMYMWCGYLDDYHRRTPSLEEQTPESRSLEGEALICMLLKSIQAVLIVLSVLELCVVISSVVLGIKSLKSREKGQNQSADDPELFSPLLEEVTTKPSV